MMASESNQEYSVNWKNHMSHIRKAFDHLLTSNELTDVTLHCEGKKIGAHKMLLSACSGYFRDTFKDVPCQHPVIFMYGVEFGVLSDILRFIYNGEVSVDTSKLDMFLKTAQLLKISGLTDCATDKIAGLNESATQSSAAPVERNVEEPFEESNTPASSGSDEARKGVKRSKDRETDTISKVMRQEDEQVFLPDVKSEPCELENFEDLLEDPLLQTDQSNDSKDFFGGEPGQSLEEEEELKYCSVSSDFEDFDSKMSSSISEETSSKVASAVLPEKSRTIYESAFERFEKWCEEQNLKNETSEDVLLAYFEYKSTVQNAKASSLWSNYSMLRSVISTRRNVDISKYKRLNAFLKKNAAGYQSKKSKILSRQDVTKFLTEADDDRFLLIKVALIIGLSGACRSDELTYLLSDNVQDEGQFFRIVIPNARTKAPQEFFVTAGLIEGLNMIEIVRKYVALRPPHIDHGRFFIAYRQGKCTRQPVGVHTFGSMPKAVASFLKLPNPEEYTGHCFRRSSASFKR